MKTKYKILRLYACFVFYIRYISKAFMLVMQQANSEKWVNIWGNAALCYLDGIKAIQKDILNKLENKQ